MVYVLVTDALRARGADPLTGHGALLSSKDQYTSICWPPRDSSHLQRAGLAGRPAAGRRGSESSHTSDSTDDEDDVPLALLAQRVRRGSEGWEVGGQQERLERDKLAWEARRERLVREFELEQANGVGT
jgi:hypothetical protein